ncbi:MAG: hypothetical protein U0869_07365 [Chloroflexota bacterium]
MSVGIPAVAPSLLLSVILGAIHTCIYVLIRGRIRAHLLLVLPAAIVGAWAGEAVGARIGDPFRLGDYCVVWASVFSWVGILVVAVATTLAGRPGTPSTAMVSPLESGGSDPEDR